MNTDLKCSKEGCSLLSITFYKVTIINLFELHIYFFQMLVKYQGTLEINEGRFFLKSFLPLAMNN